MNLSFRTRIFAALIMLLVPMLALILLAVNHTTNKQVDAFTAQSIARSRDAFKEAEDLNREVLTVLGRGLANAPRSVALFRVDDDTGFVAGMLRYDLRLSGHDSALVAFTDIEGRPIAGIIAGHAMANVTDAVPGHLLDSLLAGPDTTKFGYKLIDGRLYSIYMSLVRQAAFPIGFIIVGQPIDNAMAEGLGRAVEGEVCFVAGERCVASTATMTSNGLPEADMVEATRAGQHSITRDGKRWLLIPNALPGGAGWRVIARQMDPLLQPFDDIKRMLLRAGLLALLFAPLFAVLIARGLAKPVRALVTATARVARGDYTTHVPVTSNDELGTLSGAFNEMTQGLLLKEQYRGLLDKVISPEIAHEMLRSEISLGGENREVTIVFADIRGFTPFTEGMEPQEVIAILNETMERASAAVEREGGVVDKYIGDEIMALFGAPLSRGDDAVCAVRAAVGIRDAIQSLSDERVARGLRPISIGIGVNTGVVVAGNMGSESRLNYTVLGDAVNVAARLCSQARPQEILVGQATYDLVADSVIASSAGERMLKGMSQPIATYGVEGLIDPAAARPTHALRSIMLPLCVLAGLAVADVSHAQRNALASWTNTSGSLQGALNARMDLTAYVPQSAPPWLIAETDPFLAPRASILGEGFVGQRIYALGELRLDRGEAPSSSGMQVRIEQLFARYTVGRSLELQAGKFVSPFGSYPQRHGTAVDPFIRGPLPYEWPTLITPAFIADNTNDFIDWRDAPDFFQTIGVPPVWGVPYQAGVMAFGVAGRTSYRLAAMNSAPSSIPREWDRIGDLWRRPSLVGALAYQMTPALRAGGSVSHGPYMRERIDVGEFPAGRDDNDYMQTIAGVEATYAHQLVELRGEIFLDQWDVPNVRGRPTDYSYYVESRVKIGAGAFVGARFAQMRFNDLDWEIGGDPDNTRKEPWDYPVTRVQLGGGYQITSALSARAEYQWTRKTRPAEVKDNLLSLQFRIDP